MMTPSSSVILDLCVVTNLDQKKVMRRANGMKTAHSMLSSQGFNLWIARMTLVRTMLEPASVDCYCTLSGVQRDME